MVFKDFVKILCLSVSSGRIIPALHTSDRTDPKPNFLYVHLQIKWNTLFLPILRINGFFIVKGKFTSDEIIFVGHC